MLKNILTLKGAQTLNKTQQKEITGGGGGGIIITQCNASCGFKGQTCHPNNLCNEPGRCLYVGLDRNLACIPL